jgi:hypothetical protein
MDVVHNIVHFTVYKLNYPNIVFTKWILFVLLDGYSISQIK